MIRLACGLVFVLGFACAGDSGPAEPAEQADPPGAIETTQTTETTRSGETAPPAIEDTRFNLSIVPGDDDLRVVLEPRGEYEVETRYPYRLRFESSEGLSLERDELGRADAAELSAERAEFVVGATHADGTHRCNVEVEFAVCSESGCMPFVRTVGVDLPAS